MKIKFKISSDKRLLSEKKFETLILIVMAVNGLNFVCVSKHLIMLEYITIIYRLRLCWIIRQRIYFHKIFITSFIKYWYISHFWLQWRLQYKLEIILYQSVYLNRLIGLSLYLLCSFDIFLRIFFPWNDNKIQQIKKRFWYLLL